MIGYLWYVFPFPGPRLNNTKNWLGYPFFTDRDDVWGWFGFVRTETELHDYDQSARSNPVEFVINYEREGSVVSDSGERFVDVRFDERSWKKTGWLVNFDEDWTSSLEWSDRLTNAIDAIGSAD